jgi:hypothetical protein
MDANRLEWDARQPEFFAQHAEQTGKLLAVDSAGWQIRREVEPRPGESVVRKRPILGTLGLR